MVRKSGIVSKAGMINIMPEYDIHPSFLGWHLKHLVLKYRKFVAILYIQKISC
jgi:hypothetical protein